MHRTALVIALAATTLACSSTPEPKTEADAKPDKAESAPSQGSGEAASKREPEKKEPEKKEPAAPVAKETGKQKASPLDETVDMTSGTCADIEGNFRAFTARDLRSKIDPKLPAAKRDKAEKEADEMAKKAGEDFASMCNQSLVGKPMNKSQLRCYLNAKNLGEFQGCK